MQNSQIGKLLVASTITKHPIYAGGVCLVVHEDDDHTIGVMLNRPLQPNVAALTELMNAAAQDAMDKDEVDDVASENDFDASYESSEFDAPNFEASEFEDEDSFDDDAFEAKNEFDSMSEESWYGEEVFDADESDESTESSGPMTPGLKNRIAAHLTPGEDDQTLISDGTGMTPLGQLHFGGPVSGPVVALHGSSEHAEMQTGAGIYVAAQKDHLEQLVRENSDRFRLIVGHLRWAPGALQSEIDAGLWHPMPATAEQVFAPAAGMWPRLVRRATSRSLAHWIGVKDLVDAASRN